MKAIVIYFAGEAENLAIEERTIPKPKDGQVLVKIKAFGLNRSELMTRKGLSPNVQFPRILGIECVGEVLEDPSFELKNGQKVAAFMGGMGRDFDGSYAEYGVFPKSILMPFESNLSWSVLGALPEMFQTVYGSLHLALKIQKEETLLIRGGSSSIGLLATQMARAFGVKVIATTRDSNKVKDLLANGANNVLIDNGFIKELITQIAPQGVDKALELVGVNTLPDTLACVKQGGMVCMTGMLSEQWSFQNFAPMEVIPPTVSLTTYDSGAVRVSFDIFQKFINDIEKNTLQMINHTVFPFHEIGTAHQLMERNKASGKIVVLTENK
jgi:NADPH:quinone reductase-like Zn-dependent oxidoreductase